MWRKLSILVTTFWVGSLWMTGICASILFETIKDRQLAGTVAGHLFTSVSYIGIASALLLLTHQLKSFGFTSIKSQYFWIVMIMLILIILGHFGIQAHLAQLKSNAYPMNVMESQYAKEFASWHGVSGLIYLMECFLGIALVLSNSRID